MDMDMSKRTFDFAVRIVKLCQHLHRTAGVGRTIGGQLLRSGTSIGANVEEGKSAQSRPDFIAKYSIARKEARETNYWLRLLVASEICTEKRLSDLTKESNELVAILTSAVKTAQTKDRKATSVRRRHK